MSNIKKIIVKQLLILVCVFVAVPFALNAQGAAKVDIYVWDFNANTSEIEKYAAMLTEDFETELVKLKDYSVLQRRNHNLVVAHRDMEDAITNVTGLPSETINQLKTLRAEQVAFGKLIDDEESGVYEVTVFFQDLNNGEIQKKESISIDRPLLSSNSHRKQYMKKLIDKLHAQELLEAQNEQYVFVSEKFETYILRVKDVQIAFDDIIDIALRNEAYFRELEETIDAYNKIFIDLNANGEKYISGFEAVWGKAYGKDLESIYNDIMNDIHQKHILEMNDVRTQILEYRANQGNKKELKRLKQEIIRNSKDSSIGLTADIDKVEDQMDRLFLNLKAEMRTD